MTGFRQRSAAENADRARSALWSIPCPADRELWWPVVGSALSEGLAEDEILAWCEAGPGFQRAEALATVRSLARRRSGGTGSLFGIAIAAGWKDSQNCPDYDHKPRQRPLEARQAATEGQRPAFDFRAVWEAAEAASVAHVYVTRKLGLANGLRTYHGPLVIAGQALDGALLVPIHDADGALQSWQAIPAEGDKRSAPGAPVRGGSFVVGGPIGDSVYLAEGIGQAWSIHQASRKPAVVCFGAGNVEAIAKQLRDRHPALTIAIVCDRGKEADGERIAKAVGGAWVEMPSDWPDNSDANDLHQRDGLQAVADLLATAREPAQTYSVEYASFHDLDTHPPPDREWVIDQWIPRATVIALFGGGGIGKSLLAQQLATCVVNGVPAFGKSVRMGPVIALMCEDDVDELRRRQRAILGHMVRTPQYSSDGLFVQGRTGLDNCLMTFGKDRLPQFTPLLDTIESECERVRPVMLVLDNVAQLFGGLENDRFMVTAFCNALSGIAHRHNCAVLLLGHVAKAEGSEFSGSTAWEAAVRTRLWLERRDDGLIELHKKKANYSQRDSVVMEYQSGALVEINTQAGNPAESLLAAVAQRELLAALDVLTSRQVATSQAPTATTYLPRLAAKEGLLAGTSMVNARRALAALIDSGEILVGQPLGWIKPDRHPAAGLARKAAPGSKDLAPDGDVTAEPEVAA